VDSFRPSLKLSERCDYATLHPVNRWRGRSLSAGNFAQSQSAVSRSDSFNSLTDHQPEFVGELIAAVTLPNDRG